MAADAGDGQNLTRDYVDAVEAKDEARMAEYERALPRLKRRLPLAKVVALEEAVRKTRIGRLPDELVALMPVRARVGDALAAVVALSGEVKSRDLLGPASGAGRIAKATLEMLGFTTKRRA